MLNSFALLLVLSGVFPQKLSQPALVPASTQAIPAAAPRRCDPSFLGVLATVGWAFVVGKEPHLSGARSCPASAQDAPSKVPVRPSKTEESESPSRLAQLPAAEALRQARRLFIRQRSSRFNSEKLERELLKQKEFGALGLEITRNATHAELILEITRKRFTTRFTCSFFEPYSQRVLAAVTASSLGGEIEPHLAEAILKQFKAAHDNPPQQE